MCGLFGVVSSVALPKKDKDFITQSAFVGTLRGFDSTGMAMVDKDNEISIFKKALAGPDFLTSRVGIAAEDFLDKSFVVIGHNRAATRGGKPKDDTAHPFQFGQIVGAHNGTLDYTSGLPVTRHSVDSMNLIESLSSTHEPNEIVDLLERVRGSYAITWYDSSTEIMWFARNNERPLAIYKDKKRVYWASEYSQLVWLLSRNSLLTSKELGEVGFLPVGTLLGFDTRGMEVAHEVNFTPAERITYGTGSYGAGYGHSNKALTTHSSSSASSNKDPVYTYNDDYKANVAFFRAEDAIKKKFWAADDSDAMVVFNSYRDMGNNRKYRGTLYTFQGEQFPCSCYVNSKNPIDFNTVYVAKVAGIWKVKDKPEVANVAVIETSLDKLSKDKAEFDIMLSKLVTSAKSDNKGGAGEETKVVHLTGKSKKGGKDWYQGPNKYEYLNRDKFLQLVADGCGMCGATIKPYEHLHMGWLDGKIPICPSCIESTSDSMGDQSCTL